MTEKVLTVENVGPIERLVIPIPEGGGVVVLTGPNGSGKSHALHSIDALIAGEGALPLRDGSKSGLVAGLGAKITVGRRAVRAGILAVDALEGEDPSLLVDPGIKDPQSADLARAKALCRLARVVASPKLFDYVLSRPEVRSQATSRTWSAKSVPEMAAYLKLDMEQAARAAEEERDDAATRADTLEANVDTTDLTAASDPIPFQESIGAALQRKQAASLEAVAYATRQNAAASARKRLDDLRAKATGPTVGEIEEVITQWDLGVANLRAERTALEQKLAAIERQVTASIAAIDKANAEREGRMQTDAALTLAEQTIAEAESTPAPDPEAIPKIEAEIVAAREAIGKSALVRRAQEQWAQAEEYRAKQRTANDLADRFRAAASGAEQVVSDQISKVAPRGLTIRNGRLILATARGDEYFGELSVGERWRIAIDVAADALPPGGLLTVCQEAWEGLDPDNRAAVAAHARERGIVILTAEADSGDLRAEVAS